MVQLASNRTAEFRRRLASLQRDAARHRTDAFVDYDPELCGFTLRPITLPSYVALLAWRNAFVTGETVAFKHIAQFVWRHHPAFSQHAPRARRRVFRQLAAALRPSHPVLSPVARFFTPLLSRGGCLAGFFARFTRCFIRPTAAELRMEAIAEIRRLLREALQDFPAGEDASESSTEAGPVTLAPLVGLYPQIVSLFVRGYGLPFAEARTLAATLPLRQLVGYLREILHRLSKGKDKLITAEEGSLWSAYLDDSPSSENS